MMYYLQQTLWVISVVLAAMLLAKLAYTGLYRLYTWFASYLALEILRSIALLFVKPNSNLYAWVFLASLPLIWLVSIMAVLELYALALRNLPGIASISRWVVSGSMLVAVTLSALSLAADLSRPAGRYRVLEYYSVIERGLVFSLLLFLLLITIFLVWYPISIRRNVVLHASVYSIHFLAVSFVLFVRNVAGYQFNLAAGTVLVCVDCICFLLWLTRLSREGEEAEVVVRKKWHLEDADRLLRQLDAISQTLRRR